MLDNGQHLLLGRVHRNGSSARAAASRARFCRRAPPVRAALSRTAFACRPHGCRHRGIWRLRCLLRAVWRLADRSALIAFAAHAEEDLAGTLATIAASPSGCTNADRHRSLIRAVWRPLALAALNTPLDRASAQIFANVLRDSLGAHGRASEMWLPRADLSALLPDAVERYSWRTAAKCDAMRVLTASPASSATSRLRSALRNEPERAIEVDAVVYAAPPTHLEHIFGRSDALSATYEARPLRA